MHAARHFAGQIQIPGQFVAGDYLASPVSADTFNGLTCALWCRQDFFSQEKRALMGRLFDYHNGWCFYVQSNQLSFFCTGNPVDDPNEINYALIPDLQDWAFVAVTYNALGAAPQMKFYYGTAGENLTLIGTATRVGGFAELGVYGYMIGNCPWGENFRLNTNSPGMLNCWNGSLKHAGLWYSALSLDDLKRWMTCAGSPDAVNVKHIIEIEGVDPEPFLVTGGVPESFISTSATFTVNGTTVEYGPNIGCEYVPSAYPFYKLFLVDNPLGSIIPPPSGGAGGGDSDDDALTAAQNCMDVI